MLAERNDEFAFHTMMTWKLTFFGVRHIRHYFCDVLPLLQAACSDIYSSQVLLHVVTLFIGITPFIPITNSYIRIISTIMKIRSTTGRRKVFSTCSSHLIVVIVFYSTAIFKLWRLLCLCPNGFSSVQYCFLIAEPGCLLSEK